MNFVTRVPGIAFRSVSLAAAALAFASAAPVAAQSFGFASFSAVVTAKGATTRSSGVQSTKKLKTGNYLIEFTRPVSTCAYTASPVGRKGGQASVAPVGGQPTQIKVFTFNKTGRPANSGFIVQVSCSS